MNSILKFVICVALLLGVATAQAQLKREQRAVWMSAYVSDWPSSTITESNANTMKVACQRMLDTLAANNMNAVYYHVRAMCDAMYNSAYEPLWQSVAMCLPSTLCNGLCRRRTSVASKSTRG